MSSDSARRPDFDDAVDSDVPAKEIVVEGLIPTQLLAELEAVLREVNAQDKEWKEVLPLAVTIRGYIDISSQIDVTRIPQWTIAHEQGYKQLRTLLDRVCALHEPHVTQFLEEREMFDAKKKTLNRKLKVADSGSQAEAIGVEPEESVDKGPTYPQNQNICITNLMRAVEMLERMRELAEPVLSLKEYMGELQKIELPSGTGNMSSRDARYQFAAGLRRLSENIPMFPSGTLVEIQGWIEEEMEKDGSPLGAFLASPKDWKMRGGKNYKPLVEMKGKPMWGCIPKIRGQLDERIRHLRTSQEIDTVMELARRGLGVIEVFCDSPASDGPAATVSSALQTVMQLSVVSVSKGMMAAEIAYADVKDYLALPDSAQSVDVSCVSQDIGERINIMREQLARIVELCDQLAVHSDPSPDHPQSEPLPQLRACVGSVQAALDAAEGVFGLWQIETGSADAAENG